MFFALYSVIVLVSIIIIIDNADLRCAERVKGS
jgi:hypothetical protein